MAIESLGGVAGYSDGADAYERLRGCTDTYREALVLRLCGEVGLRPPEIARVRPADFWTLSTASGTHHLLSVRTGDEAADGREAYVPQSVRSAVRRYVNEGNIEPEDRLVAVTPRRIQMIVAEVADRAARQFGDETLAEFSSGDLCTHYARQLVHEQGVDPRVVLAIGPWDGLESLARRLDPVDDVDAIVDALERTSVSGPTADVGSSALGAAVADADLPLVLVRDGTVQHANAGFSALTGHDGRDVIGRSQGVLYADEDATPPTAEDGPVRVHLDCNDGTVPVNQTTASVGHDRSDRRLLAFAPDGWQEPGINGEEPIGGPEASVDETGASVEGTAVPVDRVTAAIAGIGDVTDVLSTASDRDAVAAGACEQLAATGAYDFAWIGFVSGDSGVAASEWDGLDEATAERLAEFATGDPGAPGSRAIEDREIRIATDAGHDSALASIAEDLAVAFVPLAYGETIHGLLTLGSTAPAAFGSEERQILESLGWQVGQAMTDVKRRNLLLADQVLELAFRTESEESFFVAASKRLDAAFDLEGFVPGEGQSLLYFVTMTGSSPDEVVGFAADADGIENARLIRDYGGSYLLEFVVAGEQPATTLTELGGQVTDFSVENGRQRITTEFTTGTDVRSVFNGLQSSFPESGLVSKREIQRPVQTTEGLRRSLKDDLTENQQSILRAAYLAGYFEWPRGSTAEELADSIGVSSPTLHNHLRIAQQKLLTAFFDDEE